MLTARLTPPRNPIAPRGLARVHYYRSAGSQRARLLIFKHMAVAGAECNRLFFRSRIINDFDEFKQIADVIVANRPSDQFSDVVEKIYTRDLFGSD